MPWNENFLRIVETKITFYDLGCNQERCTLMSEIGIFVCKKDEWMGSMHNQRCEETSSRVDGGIIFPKEIGFEESGLEGD